MSDAEGNEQRFKRARLVDRAEAPLAELNIPAWAKPPEILVAGERTFVLTAATVLDSSALVYREAFSYVVPEPGGFPEALATKLHRLADLEEFKTAVMDPLMQPSEHGTVLTRMVDKLGGDGFSVTAGRVARELANSRT
jgi:hypothetical protein